MDVPTTLKKFGLTKVFHYIYKDPEKNMFKLLDWADSYAEGERGKKGKPARGIRVPGGKDW